MVKVFISFVIVTYKSHDLIIEAIRSINENEKQSVNYEIIIVDNSNDTDHKKLLDILEKENYRQYIVEVIHNSANTGYGAGNNLGIKQAQGQIVAIMNPDVRLLEPLMNDVQSKFCQNTNLAMVGYKQLGGQNISFYRKPQYSFLFSGSYIKLKNRKGNFSPRKDFLSGAFLFIDKAKFEEIGLFDQNIFLYHEESDISNRFNSKGYDIVYDPTKSYIHLLDERPFNLNAYKIEFESLRYYTTKFNLDFSAIRNLYIKESKIKLKLAKLMGKKAAIDKFKSILSFLIEQ